MFKRAGAYTYSAIRAEQTKLGVRYTAQSKKKRIAVQLLKDFAGIGVKGQVVHVKPSTMINKLHPFGGAVYVHIPGKEPVIEVVEPSKEQLEWIHNELKSAREKVSRELEEEENADSSSDLSASGVPIQKNYSADDLLSMDDLLQMDIGSVPDTDRDAIVSKIPKKLVFRRDTKEGQLNTPLKATQFRKILLRIISQQLPNSRLRSSLEQLFGAGGFKLQLYKLQEDGSKEAVDGADEVGKYEFTLTEDGKEIATSKITVQSRS